ncbi:hypothetical protein TNCV_145991 [Trichonephila clavipes]|nr:hypothetical protein TNCV_145991 [Trichonephila clavipes]
MRHLDHKFRLLMRQLRKGALDLVSNIGAKRLKLLQPDLLQRFFNVLICLYDEDNEDNFLSGLKIILDVFKSESLPEGLIVLCQRLLLVFKYKVTDVNIRESRTSYASVKERHVWMGREIVTILPKASESLCVIAEAPELILLTLHLWSKGSFYFGIVNDISNVCLKIINFLPDEESRTPSLIEHNGLPHEGKEGGSEDIGLRDGTCCGRRFADIKQPILSADGYEENSIKELFMNIVEEWLEKNKVADQAA